MCAAAVQIIALALVLDHVLVDVAVAALVVQEGVLLHVLRVVREDVLEHAQEVAQEVVLAHVQEDALVLVQMLALVVVRGHADLVALLVVLVAVWENVPHLATAGIIMNN